MKMVSVNFIWSFHGFRGWICALCAHIKAFERRAQIAQTQNAIAMLGKGAREVEAEGEEERENAFLTGIVVCTGTICN